MDKISSEGQERDVMMISRLTYLHGGRGRWVGQLHVESPAEREKRSPPEGNVRDFKNGKGKTGCWRGGPAMVSTCDNPPPPETPFQVLTRDLWSPVN